MIFNTSRLLQNSAIDKIPFLMYIEHMFDDTYNGDKNGKGNFTYRLQQILCKRGMLPASRAER